MRRTLILVLLLALAAATLLQIRSSATPVELPDGPTGGLDCVSYAPPRFDVKSRPPTRTEIENDMRIIAKRFSCVRTYSTEGIELVPDAARKAGLRLLLGAWIGSDEKSNRREIDRLVTLANQNKDVIDALVVGNEVFLRKDQTPAQMQAHLAEVKSRTGLPVTTADIWAFWPQDPALLDTVSFVLIHILPYWDDEPSSIDTVLPHVIEVYDNMVAKFPGKPVMIGETGWPTVGRPRGALVPSRVNAARYIREFTDYATKRGFRYNLIEAFDQAWKRPNEGTVGGYWGLFDRYGQPKYPVIGPVEENPHWATNLRFALGGGVLLPLAFVLGLLLTGQRPGLVGAVMPGLVALALAGLAAGGALPPQWDYLETGNRNALDWVASLTWALAGWLVAALAVPGILATVAPRIGAGHAAARVERAMHLARYALLVGAAYESLGLVIAGRHRDFPLALLAVPVAALVLHFLASGPRRPTGPETLLAAWLAASAPLLVWIEGLRNLSALGFAGLCLALAATVLLPAGRQGAGQDQRAGKDAHGREVEAV